MSSQWVTTVLAMGRLASRAVPSGEGELNQRDDALEDRIKAVQAEELWQ